MSIFKRRKASEKETNTRYVWSVQSCIGNPRDNEVSNLKLNDLEIKYYKNENRYGISVETGYYFATMEQAQRHFNYILSAFTKWMTDNNHAVDTRVGLHSVFTTGHNINTHFDSIEEAYSMFKQLVCGYFNIVPPANRTN